MNQIHLAIEANLKFQEMLLKNLHASLSSAHYHEGVHKKEQISSNNRD